MNPIHSADWANFFIAEVGASAALTGLVVVAISINLSRILSILHLPGRAGEALVILAGALVVTSAALVPDQPAVIFGIETLVIGLVTFLVPLAMQLRSFTTASGIPRARQYFRVALSAGASLPIVVAGLLLMLGSSAGLYWIAAGVILSLIVGIFSAWVLLIEIMR
jgi:uncharacterized membrane protein YesL